MKDAPRDWNAFIKAREKIIQRLPNVNHIHVIEFVPILEIMELWIYVFFHTDENVREFEKSGYTQTIKDYFIEELDHEGRGPAVGMKLVFQFDSHENVLNNFEGNYFYRLR